MLKASKIGHVTSNGRPNTDLLLYARHHDRTGVFHNVRIGVVPCEMHSAVKRLVNMLQPGGRYDYRH